MTNLTNALLAEGKQKTKLFGDMPKARAGSVNYDAIPGEIAKLDDRQKRQLKSMKFKEPLMKKAVEKGLSLTPNTTPAPKKSGGERY